MNKILMLSLLCFTSLFGGCGKNKNLSNSKSSFSAMVTIGDLKSTDNKANSAQFALTENSIQNNAVQKTNSTWANVVGIKLKLLSIDLDGELAHSNFSNFQSEGGKVLEINSEELNGSPQFTGSIEEGSYRQISVTYSQEYDLKAYGYTSDKTCYTKKNEIVCLDGKVDPSQFLGFDYFHYNFMYISTANSPSDSTDTASETTTLDKPLIIDSSNPNANLQIRIDMYRLITLWDGSGGRSYLSPFNWSNNHGHSNTEFFPDATANFGISYIPTYVSVNDPGEIKGEVYVGSPTKESVESFDPHGYDLNNLQYLTLTYSSQNQFIGARVVNFNHDNFGLMQFISNYKVLVNGVVSFFNGEWYTKEQRYFRDRSINLFARSAINQIIEAKLGNGDDCGKNIFDDGHPEWGVRVRPCLDAEVPFYFKRVK